MTMSNFSEFDDLSLTRGAAISGECFCMLPQYSAQQFVKTGRLIEVLPTFSCSPRPIYCQFSESSIESVAMSMLREFVETNVGDF